MMRRLFAFPILLAVLPGAVCAGEPCPEHGSCFEPGLPSSGTTLGPDGLPIGPLHTHDTDAGDDEPDAGEIDGSDDGGMP